MDPQDRSRAGLDGLACAVCDGSVPDGSIELLAQRDSLAVLQVACPDCLSTSLAFIDRASLPGAPLSADDVLDMHVFLAGWSGGLAALVGDAPGPAPR